MRKMRKRAVTGIVLALALSVTAIPAAVGADMANGVDDMTGGAAALDHIISDTANAGNPAEGRDYILNADNPAEYDGYIVKLDRQAARLFSADTEEAGGNLEEVAPDVGLYRAADLDTVDRLKDAGILDYAEPNYIVPLDDNPNDPGEDNNNNNNNNNPGEEDTEKYPWYFEALNMAYAIENGVTGEGVRVGVIDSGIFAGHEEFAGARILTGKSYISTDDPKKPTDNYGHGTFVSGLIAAQTGNGVGIMGLAPDVELVPLKCFEGQRGSVINIIEAVYDGVKVWNCRVLNLSLAIDFESIPLREAIQYAYRAGVIIVAAAGNLSGGKIHNSAGDPLNYPAAWPEVIGVGALGQNLTAAYYSYRNRGVWIIAPGSDLSSLSCSNPSGYVTGRGTSYAAPMVTAAAALALSANPDLTPDEFMNTLADTARDLGDSGYDITYGHGMLNIGWTLAAARGDVSVQEAYLSTEISHEGLDLSEFQMIICSYDKSESFLSAVFCPEGAELNLKSQSDAETAAMPNITRKAFALDPDTFQPLRKAYPIRE